jgi:hypothetical protein
MFAAAVGPDVADVLASDRHAAEPIVHEFISPALSEEDIMRHQPMALAFLAAGLGAALVAMGSSSGADWRPILVGATLTAATTGIIASIMQFLPERLFAPYAIVAGVAVALVVSALLYLAENIWLPPITNSTVFVWPAAAIVALVVSRRYGVRLPPVKGAE